MTSTASTAGFRTAFIRGGFVAGFALLAVLAIHIGVQYPRAPETQPESDVTESLRRLWQDWTAFEGFQTYSINTIIGGNPDTLTPVAFVALWTGTGILLWYAVGRWRRQRSGPLPVVLFLLLGWLVLDARWLWDLQRQLQLTHDRFAGKTDVDKRNSEPGLAGASHRFAETLLDTLEPTARSARIFVLSPQRYWRYRVNYFLLPHNSVAEGVDPTGLRSGDILVLFDEPSIIGRPLAPSTHADATAGRIMLTTRDGRPLGVARMLVQHAGGYALRME